MSAFSTTEQALEALRQGKLVFISSEEKGSLVCLAEHITAEKLQFMTTHAKGLIYTPISATYAEKLGLAPMVLGSSTRSDSAFTVTIDHKDTTSGISAVERVDTILSMLEENAKPSDFRRPGHISPIIAKEGGVLVCKGHTEAAVDLARLSGGKLAAVCCDVLAQDGNLLAASDQKQFAEELAIPFITIEELQAYRREKDCLIEAISVVKMPTKFGEFMAHSFVEKITGKDHVALVKGDIGDGENVLCRIHSECLTGDAFGSQRCDCGPQFAAAMTQIEKEGRGVLLYLRQEGRGIGLINKLRAYALQDKGMDTVEANVALGFGEDEREYHIGAQMFRHLGVKTIRLLTNNPAKIEGLQQVGLNIVAREPIFVEQSEHHIDYLKVKQIKMRHMFNFDE